MDAGGAVGVVDAWHVGAGLPVFFTSPYQVPAPVHTALAVRAWER